MAVATVEPLDPAPSVILSPIAVPFWPFGAGTWFFRVAAMPSNLPPMARLTVASAEQSHVIGAGETVVISLSGGPADWYALVFATLTSGDYSSALIINTAAGSATPFQLNASGAATLLIGFPVTTIALSPHDIDLDDALGSVAITGGTTGDRITVPELVSAYDPSESKILRPPDAAFPAGGNPGPFQFPGRVVFGKGSSGPQTHVALGAETISARGGLVLDGGLDGGGADVVSLVAGTKTVDGGRIDGPTLIVLGVDPGSDLGPTGMVLKANMTLYAGAMIDASGDVIGGAAGSPNPWVGFTADWVSSVGVQLARNELSGTNIMESWRLDGWTKAALLVVAGESALWSIEDVGLHSVGLFELFAPLIEGIRMEEATTGIKASLIGVASSTFRSGRVVSRSTSDIETSGGAGGWTLHIVDYIFDMAASDSDPVLFVVSDLSLSGSTLQIERSLVLRVVDFLGVPVAGATVDVVAADGTSLISVSTGGDGWIAAQDIVLDVYTKGATAVPGGGVTAALSALVASGYLALATNRKVRITVTVAGVGVYSVLTDMDRPVVGVVTVPFRPGIVDATAEPVQIDGVSQPVELDGLYVEA